MELFPECDPYHTGYLDVPGGHRLYFEECGNPQGAPLVFLHGGPGAGISPKHRRFFHPSFWRVVLFDQRGAGQSRPHAATEANTTWDLVEDIERLRLHLGIVNWTVFGGSWGSTLGLCYAIKHRIQVDGLILRGIFLGRRREVEWLYQDGASRFHPESWKAYLAPIPEAERGDMISAYHRRLHDPDPDIRLQAAKAWSGWEGGLAKLMPDPQIVREFQDEAMALSIARLECHYCVNRFFLPSDPWILEHAHVLADLPVRIVQGRYDMTCPPESAYALYQALPNSEWVLVPDAGHSASDPSLMAALVQAAWDFQRHPPATPVSEFKAMPPNAMSRPFGPPSPGKAGA